MIVMNEQDEWAAASLHIASDTTAIDEISAVLQLIPSRVQVKGALVSPHDPQVGRRKRNVWTFVSGLDSDEPFLDHIQALLAMVEPRKQQLEELANGFGCAINVFLGYSPGNHPGKVLVDHTLIRRLATLPCSVTFDLLPPVIEDDED